jgi:hypothetical protein
MLEDSPMRSALLAATACLALVTSVALADDVTDAIDAARKAYQAGDLSGAKQSLDVASQLIGQKNAETFGKLLPAALPGWTAEPVQTTSVGAAGFGATAASRTYSRPNGDSIEVQITGDSALIAPFAMFFANPAIAGAMGKLVMIGSVRALQNTDGDLHMIANNKFLVSVQGNGSANDKIAYARAVDFAGLSKL